MIFYNEGIEPFEWTLTRQISEDGSRVVELRNQNWTSNETAKVRNSKLILRKQEQNKRHNH